MYVLDECRNSSELSVSRHERITEAYTQGLQLYEEKYGNLTDVNLPVMLSQRIREVIMRP
jgi:hypothetical protein